MTGIPLLDRLLLIPFSAPLGRGFGHMGGHFNRGVRLQFGLRLIIVLLVAIPTIVLASQAARSASEWTARRYGQLQMSRAAGLAIFLAIILVVGFALARIL
jgi:hypothetical protein